MENLKASLESYLLSDTEALNELKRCKDFSGHQNRFKEIIFSRQDVLGNIDKKRSLILYLGIHKAKRMGAIPAVVNYIKVRLKRILLQEVSRAA